MVYSNWDGIFVEKIDRELLIDLWSVAYIDMKTFVTLIIVILAVNGCQKRQEPQVPASLSAYFHASSIPAAVMGYAVKGGRMTWYCFGPSRWGESDTVTEDHIFRIMSMTKAISSVAALQLVEKGLI